MRTLQNIKPNCVRNPKLLIEVIWSFITVHVEMKICNYLICSTWNKPKKKKKRKRERERGKERKKERKKEKKNIIKRNMTHHYQHHRLPPQWAYLFLVTIAQVSFSCWWRFYIALSLCNENSGKQMVTWQHLYIRK